MSAYTEALDTARAILRTVNGYTHEEAQARNVTALAWIEIAKLTREDTR